jgi:hypothetical protein
MSTKVAAATLATIAACGYAWANIVLTCSGTMEVPGFDEARLCIIYHC